MDINHLKTVLHNAHFDNELEQDMLLFIKSYQQAIAQSNQPQEKGTALFEQYIHLIQQELAHPTEFSHFHPIERSPFDFYEFSLNAVRLILDQEHSSITGLEHLQAIIKDIEQGHNVILLANHQTEIDPQILSLLITPHSYNLASSMIFIAGHRVIKDPIAIPFSRGTNILCIHSKRYLDFPPEEKSAKLFHNAKTLSKLEEIFNQGGACIYVAPSGGRDRYDESGQPQIAPFDSQSVELFYMLSQKVPHPTHIHLLAMSTIRLLPPPQTINIEIGERREVAFGPAHLSFSPPIDMQSISTNPDRKQQRQDRSVWMTDTIKDMHTALLKR